MIEHKEQGGRVQMEDVELFRKCKEALAELDDERGFPLQLITVEKMTEPDFANYYKLRFLGGHAITFHWKPDKEPLSKAVQEAVQRDIYGSLDTL